MNEEIIAGRLDRHIAISPANRAFGITPAVSLYSVELVVMLCGFFSLSVSTGRYCGNIDLECGMCHVSNKF